MADILGLTFFGITHHLDIRPRPHVMGSLRVYGDIKRNLMHQKSFEFFRPYSVLKPSPVHPYRAELGPYLAGLIEGDGTLYVPKSFRHSRGQINHCTISIPFWCT